MTGAVDAYWTAGGTGTGSGPVGTLAAPTITDATPGVGTVALSWDPVTPLGAPAVSYFVTRNPGSVGGSCAGSISGPSCTDTGLIPGPYSYTVTAVWQSWTATSSPATQVTTLAFGALDHFVLAPATTTPTAGQADNLTITAKDSAGITVTTYTGTQCLTFSGPANSPNGTAPIYPVQGSCPSLGQSAVTFTDGAASANVVLYKAGTVSIVVSDGSGHSNGAGLSVTVSPAGAASFTIPTPGTQATGIQFSVSITAKDAYGNTATGYAGTQCLTFSGPANSPNGTTPIYPVQGSCPSLGQSAVTFTSGVAATVPITLYNPSTSTILTATDALLSSRNGSTGAFTVNAVAVASFTISTPGSQTAGTAFSVSITAVDATNQTVTGYTGPQCLIFSGPAASPWPSPNGTAPIYPVQGSCPSLGQSAVTFTDGVAATVTLTLYNASPSTILTATDAPSGVHGSTVAFAVGAATAASYSLADTSGNPLGAQTAGTAFSVSITAKDINGNTATSYFGSKCLTFSGPAASPWPPSPNGTAPSYPAQGSCGAARLSAVTFTNGVAANVSLTLYNASSPTIPTILTATDAPLTGSTAFTVNAAARAGIVLSSIAPNTAPAVSCSGSIDAITCSSIDEGNSSGNVLTANLTLVDQFGNAVTNNTGSSIGIDLGVSGKEGAVTTSDRNPLSIGNESSTTSASFTLTRDPGNGKTVTMTATVHVTAQTLTVKLSSAPA